LQWRIYSCIVQKGLGKGGEEPDTVSLKDFAKLLTSMYPADIKDKITAAVGSIELGT